MQVAKVLTAVAYVSFGARKPACTPSARRHGVHDRQFVRQFDCKCFGGFAVKLALKLSMCGLLQSPTIP